MTIVDARATAITRPFAVHSRVSAGTLMIEPTESEDKAELDRFADAQQRADGPSRPRFGAALGRDEMIETDADDVAPLAERHDVIELGHEMPFHLWALIRNIPSLVV